MKPKTIAEKLVAWRAEQGDSGKPLPQRDAAERLGVTQSRWHKWEHGSPPKAADFARLVDLTKGSEHAILWVDALEESKAS